MSGLCTEDPSGAALSAFGTVSAVSAVVDKDDDKDGWGFDACGAVSNEWNWAWRWAFPGRAVRSFGSNSCVDEVDVLTCRGGAYDEYDELLLGCICGCGRRCWAGIYGFVGMPAGIGYVCECGILEEWCCCTG